MSRMAFFNSSNIKHAKKDYVCECCGAKISAGDPYARESGKYDGDMFDRKLHPICAAMEREYCEDVDTEFSWDAVQDHISDKYCYDCEHSNRFDDKDGWQECDTDIYHCPRIRKALMPEGSAE